MRHRRHRHTGQRTGGAHATRPPQPMKQHAPQLPSTCRSNRNQRSRHAPIRRCGPPGGMRGLGSTRSYLVPARQKQWPVSSSHTPAQWLYTPLLPSNDSGALLPPSCGSNPTLLYRSLQGRFSRVLQSSPVQPAAGWPGRRSEHAQGAVCSGSCGPGSGNAVHGMCERMRHAPHGGQHPPAGQLHQPAWWLQTPTKLQVAGAPHRHDWL